MEHLLSLDMQISHIHTIYHAVQLDWSRPQPFPRHTNALVFVTEGSIEYRFPDSTVRSCPGDVLALPKGLVYSGVSRNPVNSFYVLDFETVREGELQALLPRVLHPENSRETELRFRRICEIWNGDTPTGHLRCRGMLYALLEELVTLAGNGSEDDWAMRLVSETAAFLKASAAEPELTVAAAAERVHLSQSQLRRLFRKVLGRSPLEYLQDVRLSMAKNLLLYSSLSVGEIAVRCGYDSYSYFSRAFRKQTGLCPTQFRRR
ncbi:MAG: helix-turn-helix transcriptional regulator [Oscillospiraceae bacterium]|nr:helix-turn-helix transcriptional regulator [Oscillospiraceae bacterium]